MDIFLLIAGWLITYGGLIFCVSFFTVTFVGFHREGKARLAAYNAAQQMRAEAQKPTLSSLKGRPGFPQYAAEEH